MSFCFADLSINALPGTFLTLIPVDIELCPPDAEPGVGLADHIDRGRHKEERRVEDPHEDDEDHVDPGVVPELVRHKAHDGWRDEDAEGEDGVDQADVHVADADVLHVDGEVGHDGKGGAVEEEEGALQGQKVHVWPEAATLRGSRLLKEEI